MTIEESGIDSLIKRVRDKAIGEAHIEAQKIIDGAKIKADSLMKEAQVKADLTIKAANQYAADEREKLDQELQLAARDFLIKLSERLKQQMHFPVIKKSIRATLKEPDFLKQVLEKLILDYTKNNSKSIDILIPKELKTTLCAFFASAIFDEIEKKNDIKLIDEEGIEGFVLIEKQHHYFWDFTAETIARELSRLVEPTLKKYFVLESPVKKPIKAQDAHMAL